MLETGIETRYEAVQILEAVGRARGDGRYFLVRALLRLDLPVEESRDVLEQALEEELRPDERQMILARLACLRPTTYLPTLIETGLRSRSINVQQMTVAVLPDLVIDGLSPELADRVEGWLRRRLANPRRADTWAMWEIPDVARALMLSYGPDRTIALLRDIEPKMQPEERRLWSSLEREIGDPEAFEGSLERWSNQDSEGPPAADPRDPTAEISVDRAMKRLGFRPANPQSRVYDSLADHDVPTYVIDVRGDREPDRLRD